jgi:protocatechuate 3,4-dioxygenase, alpha subunit
MSLTPTPGQTVGPFFHYALPYDGDSELVPPGAPGAVRLHGTVYDGAGAPVPDAILELWQADAAGEVVQQAGSLRRDGWTFTGFGRSATDREGHYSFTTLVPGVLPGESASFFAITVLARGLLHRLFTRAYLPGTSDAFLDGLDADRRATLVTKAEESGFRFDVRLQGEDETVFLDFGDE